MMMTRVTIELEFDRDVTKDDVVDYLLELIEDDSLSYLVNGDEPPCSRCNGEMRIDDYEHGDLHSTDGKMPCPTCEGNG